MALIYQHVYVISEIAPLITSINSLAMKQHATKIAFLCFLPDFNLNHQLRVINENFIARRRKSTIPLLDTGAFFAYAVCVFVLVMGFFVVVLEHKYYLQRLRDFFKTEKLVKKSSSSGISPTLPLDNLDGCLDDCLQEKQRVRNLINGDPSAVADCPLIVNNLSKSYAGQRAVNGLSFAAVRGECFGLLGVNGAGKTTTFQMITANLAIDSGSIQIDGIDIRKDEVAFRQRFGYCPQYDALNKFMTAEQSLRFMALMRGLSSSKEDQAGVEASVQFWLHKMNLLKYRDVQVRNYSGGTKRKLLAAMAMIGAPSLVLLDEPTTGVDPISRRFLWQCIKDFQSSHRTVVLTSHR